MKHIPVLHLEFIDRIFREFHGCQGGSLLLKQK